MKHFVGIDLGTTNSAICTYDGTNTRVWKSPEQNDVTPSAIFFDRRGNRYDGKRAYDSIPNSPDSGATLFKRLMGTSTPINIKSLGISMTPEQCSARILQVLYGYLPEEIRNDENTGTVITVPAAFNQMQKDATMQAAMLASIGNVSLMQEPVAAVMSVVRSRNTDGIFLIYDFGGGTLDIAIAESISGRVNLLANGGIAMCGGRDFDRALLDNVVRPWLLDNFALPQDFSINPAFKKVMHLATWATEKAKIELSSREESVISIDIPGLTDLQGKEMYLDIPLSRSIVDKLIAGRIMESIEAARETIAIAGLTTHDLDRIVFIGGPTNYKPLRDKVSFELGLPPSTEVNPMTAVAEGASLFAESIDWSTNNRSRKDIRGSISSGGRFNVNFSYIARTPDVKSRIVVVVNGVVSQGCEFQIDSIDTGWTSGRLPLLNGATAEVLLSQRGDNVFKVFVFDPAGGPVSLEQDKIVITRTAATVDAIPASHSIGIELTEKLGGRPALDYLVRAGDRLPVKGKRTYRAGEIVKAGSTNSLNFKLWEGEIEEPVEDNRPIGVLKITGLDFDAGVIPFGADLECDFEVFDSGNIMIEVSIPCIGSSFPSGRNFYSRQEGQVDYSSESSWVLEEGDRTLRRIEALSSKIANPKLDQARQKVESATSIDQTEPQIEQTQEAMEKVLHARRLLAQVKKEHLKEIRQLDLDLVAGYFENNLRELARPSESEAFDSLKRTAQRSLERNDRDFENLLDQLRDKNWDVLWRQDWFVIDRFESLSASPHNVADRQRFDQMVNRGQEALRSDDIDMLRTVVGELYKLQIRRISVDEMQDKANILRG